MRRRDVLGAIGVGIVGTSGCLRFQPGDSAPSDDTATPNGETPDGESSQLTLSESWTDESGVDFIWTDDGKFYYNDYNYAAEASHGSGISWSNEVTHEGVEDNLGADAFASQDRYAVFGYTPDPEGNEQAGAHFHAFDTVTGEELWVSDAPSDGKHNGAVGATVVDDIVVFATTDYGQLSEQEPLVWGVDIETGEQLWQTGNEILPTSYTRYLDSYDGTVYVSISGDIHLLDGATGSLIETKDSWSVGRRWGKSLGEIHGDTLFAVSGDTINAHPVGTGGLDWSTSETDVWFSAISVDNSLVVVGIENGDILALDRSSGDVQWEQSIPGAPHFIEPSGRHIWVADRETGLTAYDRETGRLLHRSTKPVNRDDIAVVNDVILLGGDAATAYDIE